MLKTPVYTLLSLAFLATNAAAQVARIQKPKLILTLVVDQFRADQLARFQSRFLPAGTQGEPGGFRYLMERGAYYPQAEYGLLQNMTGPGHATVLSGSYAYQHGIPVNIWYDQNTGKSTYCVEDNNSPLVGAVTSAAKRGASPRNFQGTTLGDELKNSGYSSRVVTVALKDRSAVLLGGARADLALWFDADSLNWISSRYYLPDGQLPAWVQGLNQSLKSGKPQNLVWELPSTSSGTSWADNKLVVPSKTTDAIGLDFPHKSQAQGKEALNFPIGSEWTTNAAIAAIDGMKLGRGSDVDLLGVSYSNHDFVSHTYGPNSRELEELMVAEDREIARLLAAVQKSVGLDHVVIAMTGDHGGMPSAEWLKASKMDAGRVDQDSLRKQGEDFLQKTFGPPKEGAWLPLVVDFNFYLNHKALQQKGIDPAVVLQKLKRFYQKEATGTEGVLYAFTETDVQQKTVPPGLFQAQIYHTYRMERSGDLVMILKPNYVPPGSTADHVSGYTYDRMVPLLLAGPQIKAGVYGQKAEVVDIAPTLAFFAGTLPPATSEGRILHEILHEDKK